MDRGKRIKEVREERGLTQEELGRLCGTTKQTIFKYENNIVTNIPTDRLEKLSVALKVTPAYLMGWEEERKGAIAAEIFSLPKMREWTVLGATACGAPLHRETPGETVIAPEEIRADVVFRCVGDSMINARIFDGDAVFVRLQPEVENGQIAVVRTGDEYALKRVYRGEGYVELRPENPMYSPRIIREQELDDFEVIGLAVAFTGSLESR